MEGLPGITRCSDDKTQRRGVTLSTPSPGEGRGRCSGRRRAPASWGHPGTALAAPLFPLPIAPAWILLFSRILPDLQPPPPPSGTSHCIGLISRHLMSPRQENTAPQPPPHSTQPAPPHHSQRHFTRTDDAAKTTIMIINSLNLEDYAVN